MSAQIQSSTANLARYMIRRARFHRGNGNFARAAAALATARAHRLNLQGAPAAR